jgi:hypothetical protein
MQAQATLPPALPSGTDFADWLSPILVKELRQGLKSRVFVATFIIVQVVMILLVGMQLLTLAGGERGVVDAFDGFFWTFVLVPLLIMMPARGLTAVSEEVKANTLDLVQLTRLTAFRIVLGKWIALGSQTLLLVAAILPYAVLRYFFGEVDVVDDLRSIGVGLLSSLFLTAGAIALSSANLAVRVIVLVLLFPVFFFGSFFTMAMRAMGGSSPISGTWEWGWAATFFAAVYTYLMLEIAAARIAPISENHAAPKRLLALGLGLGSVVMAIFAGEDATEMWMAASVFACGWIVLESLCERTVLVPSLYLSFARRGAFGRLAGRLLYPGWASGLVFVSILAAMLLAAMGILASQATSTLKSDQPAILALGFPIAFAAVIAPVVVLLFFPKVRQPMWLYILVQAICALLYLVANIAAGSSPVILENEAYRWLALFPTSTVFAILDESDNEGLMRFFSVTSVPVCAAIAGYLAFRVLREFRVIARLERESLGQRPSA